MASRRLRRATRLSKRHRSIKAGTVGMEDNSNSMEALGTGTVVKIRVVGIRGTVTNAINVVVVATTAAVAMEEVQEGTGARMDIKVDEVAAGGISDLDMAGRRRDEGRGVWYVG